MKKLLIITILAACTTTGPTLPVARRVPLRANSIAMPQMANITVSVSDIPFAESEVVFTIGDISLVVPLVEGRANAILTVQESDLYVLQVGSRPNGLVSTTQFIQQVGLRNQGRVRIVH